MRIIHVVLSLLFSVAALADLQSVKVRGDVQPIDTPAEVQRLPGHAQTLAVMLLDARPDATFAYVEAEEVLYVGLPGEAEGEFDYRSDCPNNTQYNFVRGDYNDTIRMIATAWTKVRHNAHNAPVKVVNVTPLYRFKNIDVQLELGAE